jgi:hypothetical protein
LECLAALLPSPWPRAPVLLILLAETSSWPTPLHGCEDRSPPPPHRSAEDRICAVMNRSVREVAMFELRPPLPSTGPPPPPDDPEPFWLAPLERYMRGGGCAAKVPPQRVCPNASKVGTGPAYAWRHAADTPAAAGRACCESNSNRGPGFPLCQVACAKRECESDVAWEWVPQNYSLHPFLCCRV